VKRFPADLHIHTAVSPCAADEMTPPAIVRAASREGLMMVAICDHNTTAHTTVVQKAAGTDVAVIAGIEITTAEEAHVLALFPDAEHANAVGKKVRATLPENRNGFCSSSPLMDSAGRVIGSEPKMLAAASTLELEETVRLIRKNHGLAVAAHVDRPSFSVVSQLGIFPDDAGFDAVEISPVAARSLSRSREFETFGLPVITSSDAHFLSDVGSSYTVFEMREPTFAELTLALRSVGGRRLWRA